MPNLCGDTPYYGITRRRNVAAIALIVEGDCELVDTDPQSVAHQEQPDYFQTFRSTGATTLAKATIWCDEIRIAEYDMRPGLIGRRRELQAHRSDGRVNGPTPLALPGFSSECAKSQQAGWRPSAAPNSHVSQTSAEIK